MVFSTEITILSSVKPSTNTVETRSIWPPSSLRALVADSCSDQSPPCFKATNLAPLLQKGRQSSSSSGNLARALTTTKSNESRRSGSRAKLSARPVCTETPSSPSFSSVWVRNAVFLATDSTRVSSISGKANLSARPGRPAPDPTSITRVEVCADPARISRAVRQTVRESKKCFTWTASYSTIAVRLALLFQSASSWK